MAPHDQHCPEPSLCSTGIAVLTDSAMPTSKTLHARNTSGCSPGRFELGQDGRAYHKLAGVGARSTQSSPQHAYAEKELPQPQDFVACGFTKTKPCCIRVS